MSIGFGFDGKEKKQGVKLNMEEVDKLTKEYKKLKKYMKSTMYELQTLNGSETVISELLDKYGDK
jgi:predicted  nucleic acid-binding Zn-ribbon protein